VKAHQAEHPVQTQCRVLGVSVSGYYASVAREPSARAREDARLLELIRAAHAESRGTYGARRVHAELVDNGEMVGRDHVARLMRSAGLEGVSPRKWTVTTRQDADQGAAPDLVQRKFKADGPNRLWVADITYVPTWEGFIYLAVVLDVWCRRVVGWAMSASLATPLVLAALEIAVRRRQPTGVIHHSDKGCQYTSVAFGQRCIDAGIKPSTGTVGDAYDNAMAESFFSTIEHELFARQSLKSKDQARDEVFSYIEGWYNPRRRHSALGYKSPQQFEEAALEAALLPSP
jgi:transposase InsO family protein